jgi:four helix bundle protein
MSDRPSFPQHRLDVYRVAVELAQKAREAARSIPRGDRSLADQMKRSATSTVLLIAEGANRRSPGDKRQRYSLARGECGELASVVELAGAYNVLDNEQVVELLVLAGRTNAMLLRLEQRFGGVTP